MGEITEKQIILIVDDSRTNIMALAELLKDEWVIRVANNGKTALRIAESSHAPDIILLDVMMPEMDGYEVCKKLKESHITNDIPVIFVTAMDQAEDEEYGLSLGAIDYITKPYRPLLVKDRVRNHLELKKYRDMLKKYSMIDGLTGIPNRNYFNDTFTRHWSRAVRYGTNISLLMIDIDYFKKYNDTYGHLEGDTCLRQVAMALQCVPQRATDIVARWGGEEFACLLPDTDQSQAIEMAEKICHHVAELEIPHQSSLISDIVTVSLGVATMIPEKDQNPDMLVNKADKALYAAKEAGRNRVVAYDDVS